MAKKRNHIEGLFEWLEANRIQYIVIDEETVEIPGFGKAAYQDTEKTAYKSIFCQAKDGSIEFHSTELIEVLKNEGVEHIIFKFGKNYYYHTIDMPFALNILKYVGERIPCKCEIPFVNLGVHTAFELLNGSFMPSQWVKKAKYLGHNALGICDHNTMAACFALQSECEASEIGYVYGYSLTVDCGDMKFDAKIYVQSQIGWRNLLRIQKAIMVDNVDEKTISLKELERRGEGNVLVIDKLFPQIAENKDIMEHLTTFRDVYYQVDLSEYKAERIDIQVLEAVKYYFHNIYHSDNYVPPVLICDCYYLDKDDARNKIILNKVAEGAAHKQSDDQYFKDVDEHYAVFERLFDSEKWDVLALFKECCENTVCIAENAIAKIDTSRNYMPKYDMTEEEKQKYGTTHNMFNQLLEERLQLLSPPDKIEQYRARMEAEKYIIETTDNVDYLLVQYDTCNWARQNNILVGCGRGSAAGSLLLYLLGITLIDPIKYDLIFERFLIPERAGYAPAQTTIVGNDLDSTHYIELELENGKTYNVDVDAMFMVRREGEEEPIKCYADELTPEDDIIFDSKDLIFTLNEI